MVDVFNLYVDDSGSRKLDRKQDQGNGRNWFGLGGLIVRDRDEAADRNRYADFVSAWPQMKGIPLHSEPIRHAKKNFRWLRDDEARASEFLTALTELICASSFTCIAAVIDRPGYRARYETKYQPIDRWDLCKTAFAILVERSAKYAADNGARLRVFIEKGDKKTDDRMLLYYNSLRSNGMPFDQSTMSSYAPLAASDFASTLYECRFKDKTSPMMQMADLCLYPICRAGYQSDYRPYLALVDRQKLINRYLQPHEHGVRGIKYSCFPSQTADGSASVPLGLPASPR
jgi:hypothetical protein